MNADLAVVDGVLAKAPGAFERLVREHQALCWHIIYRMVGHSEDARELCQETFLRVYQSLHQFRYESTLKSWIGRVAYSIALRHLERRRISPAGPVAARDDDVTPLENIRDEFDLEAACADAEMARRLHTAIEALPPLQRTILTLYHLEDASIAQIAQITGLADGTIKSHLFRSRLRLREALEPQVGVVT